MRLDRKQIICGFPVKTVRDFLRRDHTFDLDFVCEKLCLSKIKAREFIKNLKSMGLIETDKDYKGEDRKGYWQLTMKGFALRNANLLKPLEKEKALRILNAFLERVQEVNRNKDFRYIVIYIGLFGSLSKGAEDVGDIDIAIQYQLRPIEERLGDDKGAYRYHANHLNKVRKFLQDRNPYLSLVSQGEQELNELGIFPKQLFPVLGSSEGSNEDKLMEG